MTRLGWVACVLLGTALGLPARADEGKSGGAPLKVAVIDIRASGADDSAAKTFSEILAVEVAKLPDVQVISNAEVESLLGLEQRKQMLGCDDNVSCAAEIAGALGVDKLCTGSLGKVDSTAVLTLRVIDVKSAKVDQRLYETESGGASAFIRKMPDLVARLFPSRSAPPPAKNDSSFGSFVDKLLPSKSAPPAASDKPAQPVAASDARASDKPAVAPTKSGGSSWATQPWVWATVGAVLILSGGAFAGGAKTADAAAGAGTLVLLGAVAGTASLGLCICGPGKGSGGDEAPVPVIQPRTSPFDLSAER